MKLIETASSNLLRYFARTGTGKVDEHNRVLPQSACRGQTPDEMYFGTGEAVPADLTSRAPPRAGRALRQADRRRARHARQSTRPRDHGADRRSNHGDATGPRASGGDAGRTCRLNDEDSRGKVQNVRGVVMSGAHPVP